MNIDWDAYKEHKQYSVRNDNFEITLEFMKSYYNMTNPYDIFDALKEDDIGQMMLNKRNITDAVALEKVLHTI
ncbi:hypothetical protein [Sulfurimonas microaerophilic]|uniref:hypothetical protein n=1 Tax=Sulfurimonas microaerophilic TaxID=3058392 RepID=UPI0027153CCB|nr:hypothetical protein [Sulfurimonas sp. hsl 1-7]